MALCRWQNAMAFVRKWIQVEIILIKTTISVSFRYGFNLNQVVFFAMVRCLMRQKIAMLISLAFRICSHFCWSTWKTETEMRKKKRNSNINKCDDKLPCERKLTNKKASIQNRLAFGIGFWNRHTVSEGAIYLPGFQCVQRMRRSNAYIRFFLLRWSFWLRASNGYGVFICFFVHIIWVYLF